MRYAESVLVTSLSLSLTAPDPPPQLAPPTCQSKAVPLSRDHPPDHGRQGPYGLDADTTPLFGHQPTIQKLMDLHQMKMSYWTITMMACVTWWCWRFSGLTTHSDESPIYGHMSLNRFGSRIVVQVWVSAFFWDSPFGRGPSFVFHHFFSNSFLLGFFCTKAKHCTIRWWFLYTLWSTKTKPSSEFVFFPSSWQKREGWGSVNCVDRNLGRGLQNSTWV